MAKKHKLTASTGFKTKDGKAIDIRYNPWDSVALALQGIQGNQRVEGATPVPVRVNASYGLYWFVGGTEDKHFVPYNPIIGQEDALIYGGFSFNADKTECTLDGTKWRISDIPFTLQNPVTFDIPEAEETGLFRADIIYADYQGEVHYLAGTAGETAVAPEVPYKTILVTTIYVSLEVTEEIPAPVSYPDVRFRSGTGDPTQALGIAGDSYLNESNGEVWFKTLIVDEVATWEKRYTPVSGSGVPDGGTTGQILKKLSDDDGDADWQDESGSSNTLVNLTDASTIAWDFSEGNIGKVSISDNRGLTITNLSGVQTGILKVKHLSAGTTITLPDDSDNVNWATEVDKVTLLGFLYDGAEYTWDSNVSGSGSGSGPVDLTPPVLQAAEIEGTNTTRVVLAYDEELLTTSVPDFSDFTLSGGRTVTGISFNGVLLYLDFDTEYLFSEGTTISYTGGTNKIKDLAGNIAADFTSFAIDRGVTSAIDWTLESNAIDEGAGTLNITATNSGAHGVDRFGDIGSYIQFKVTTPVSDCAAVVMGLHATNVASYAWGGQSMLIAVYQNASAYTYHVGTTSTALPGAPAPASGHLVRLERTTTNNVTVGISTNNGVSFTVYYTAINALSGNPSPYVKAIRAAGGTKLLNGTQRII